MSPAGAMHSAVSWEAEFTTFETSQPLRSLEEYGFKRERRSFGMAFGSVHFLPPSGLRMTGSRSSSNTSVFVLI